MISLAWHCIDEDDPTTSAATVTAPSPREAAEEYAEYYYRTLADYSGRTVLACVGVHPAGQQGDNDDQSFVIPVHPTPPECNERSGHQWKEKGVWGHGGGIIISDVCAVCSVARTQNTGATNPTDGSQGHVTVAYDYPYHP